MLIYVSTNTIKKYKLNQRNTTFDQSGSEGLEVFRDPMLGGCEEETSPCEVSLLLSRDLFSPVPQPLFCLLAPFPFWFFPLCVLETLSLLPRPGLCSDAPPNQTKSCFFPDMSSASVLFRHPWPPPHVYSMSTHMDWARIPGLCLDKPGCPSSQVGAVSHVPSQHGCHITCARLPSPPHSILFSQFSRNRKQLPGWDSPLPPNREIIYLVYFIQVKNRSKTLLFQFAKAQVKIWFSCFVCEPVSYPIPNGRALWGLLTRAELRMETVGSTPWKESVLSLPKDVELSYKVVELI